MSSIYEDNWFQFVLDHPEKNWNSFRISKNPNITWKNVQDNPNFQWFWSGLSVNSAITWEIVRDNPNFPWDWDGLTINKNITIDIVKANLDRQWNWKLLFPHNVNITYLIVQENPTLPWPGCVHIMTCATYAQQYAIGTWESVLSYPEIDRNYYTLSMSPYLDWPSVLASNAQDRDWDYFNIIRNPSVTYSHLVDIIDAHQLAHSEDCTRFGKLAFGANPTITFDFIKENMDDSEKWDSERFSEKWDSERFSENPNVSWQIVIDNPEFDWDYNTLSANPMTKYAHWDIVAAAQNSHTYVLK